MIQYYSNITKEFYETEEACLKAEQAHKAAVCKKEEEERRKAEERKNRADEVDKARIAFEEAKSNYYTLLNSYCRDYGFYTFTPNSVNSNSNSSFPRLSELARSLGIL